MKTLIFVSEDEAEKIMDTPDRVRDRVMLRLFLKTGIRRGELQNLYAEDIDFRHGRIKICRGKGGKDREVPVDANTLFLLRAYLWRRSTGPVFLSHFRRPIASRVIEYLVKKYAKDAGVRYAAEISPRILRHSFAINWVQHHGDIETLRRILGHSSLRTTQIYLDFDFDRVETEYQQIHGQETPLWPA